MTIEKKRGIRDEEKACIEASISFDLGQIQRCF